MRADEARAAGDEESILVSVDHPEGVEWRLRLRTVPPSPPRTRIATPPPRRARIELSLPEEACELDARSTAEGSVSCRLGVLAAPALEAGPRPPWLPEEARELDARRTGEGSVGCGLGVLAAPAAWASREFEPDRDEP